ncbi:MAG: carbohydrate ABC transporter permease, partial [Oscillibacter sp.]|nr:carbohydrate ABC transporter permease [Oscillibacter sp.]
GGLIPNYILATNLGLVNTRWALIFGQGTISIYNMIIMRTYFQNSIPYELFEAAKVDGISDFQYLIDIVIPLSKAIFAVITLYYAVAHWNSYFDAMLYLRNRDLYPLQLVLRDILSVGNIDLTQFADPEAIKELSGVRNSMNYALIVIGSLPLLIAYPFVQKFFEKGVMIGSVKG